MTALRGVKLLHRAVYGGCGCTTLLYHLKSHEAGRGRQEGKGGMGVTQRGVRRASGEQSQQRECEWRLPWPAAKADQLPARSMLLNRHLQSAGPEYAARYFKVPGIEIAASQHRAAGYPNPLLYRLQPLCGR